MFVQHHRSKVYKNQKYNKNTEVFRKGGRQVQEHVKGERNLVQFDILVIILLLHYHTLNIPIQYFL